MKKNIKDFFKNIPYKYINLGVIIGFIIAIVYQQYRYIQLNTIKVTLEDEISQLQLHVDELEISTFDLEVQINVHKQYIQQYKQSNDKLNKRLRTDLKELESRYAEINESATTCEEKLKAHEKILDIFNERYKDKGNENK